MLVKAREVLLRLVNARAAVDYHDGGEFSSPPYELYDEARKELERLEHGEHAKLAEGLTDSLSSIRIEAAKAIEHLFIREARPALERGLADPEAKVRDACAEALAAVSPASVLSTLVERGIPVSTQALSQCASAAVARLGVEALPWVVRSGLSPRDGKAAWARLYELDREETAKAFERGLVTGDPSWAGGVSTIVREKGGAWARPVFSALVQHAHKGIQFSAVESLAAIGDATSIEVVLGLLATDQPGVQRGPASMQPPVPVPVQRGLFQRDAALRAVFAIGRRTRTPVVERVIAAAAKNAKEQCSLMHELTRLADCTWEAEALDSIENAVREALSHPDEETVLAALKAATFYRFEALADEVVATLAHRRGNSANMSSVRREFIQRTGAPAFRALARRVEAALRTNATDTTLMVGVFAAELLAESFEHGREHVPLLLQALTTSHSGLRGAAAWSLGRFGTREATDTLLEMAATAPPDPAYRAVQALIRWREPRVIPIVLRYLAPFLAGAPIATHEQAWMSACCVTALEAGGADALDALRRLLAHADRRMRRDAADALGATGDPSAIPWLEPLERDKEPQVKQAARVAITRLRGAAAR